jgi:hypothetical protein
MLEARGEDILAPARIKVSTFHAMKGGEDDNCAVLLASTKRFSIDWKSKMICTGLFM